MTTWQQFQERGDEDTSSSADVSAPHVSSSDQGSGDWGCQKTRPRWEKSLNDSGQFEQGECHETAVSHRLSSTITGLEEHQLDSHQTAMLNKSNFNRSWSHLPPSQVLNPWSRFAARRLKEKRRLCDGLVSDKNDRWHYDQTSVTSGLGGSCVLQPL